MQYTTRPRACACTALSDTIIFISYFHAVARYAHVIIPSDVPQTCVNESTAGADASVEALKLYHMKLTLAQ